MALVINKNQAWAAEIEDTPGTYKAPTSGNKFIQTLADGAEMNRTKEVVERNVFTSSIGKTQSRNGMFSVAGSIPVEAKASSTEGAAPEFDALLMSGLGSKHQLTSEITTLTGNTDSILKVTDASLFQVGDILLIKEAGKYHVSPVKSINTTTDEVELLIPASDDFSDNVVIAKHTTYSVSDSNHASLSISRYLEGTIVQKALGAKVNAISFEGFATGQIPSLSFGFEGLNFDSILASIPYTPSYSSQLPPIILDARVYMDGQSIDVNELTSSIENTLAYQTSVNEANGKKSSRFIERAVSGSFNPYMASDSMANYNKFKNNTPFSIVAFAKLPSSTAGEFSGVVALYFPNCVVTELSEADQDGILQDSISFVSNRGNAGDIPEFYIAFI